MEVVGRSCRMVYLATERGEEMLSSTHKHGAVPFSTRSRRMQRVCIDRHACSQQCDYTMQQLANVHATQALNVHARLYIWFMISLVCLRDVSAVRQSDPAQRGFIVQTKCCNLTEPGWYPFQA